MKLLKKTTERKNPQDVVAVDLGSSGTKVVRMKKTGDLLTVTGVDLLPPISIAQEEASDLPPPQHLPLAKSLVANYAALCFSSRNAVVRVVSVPGLSDQEPGASVQLREHIGLDEHFRVSYVPTSSVRGKEAKLLAVAVPENEVQPVLALVAHGAPAPFSLELSGLAALNACLAGPLQRDPQAPACVVECGSQISLMAIFNKGVLVLARKLDVGGESIIQRVQKQLGLDRAMAESIIAEGAIDISQTVSEVIDPFIRQLTISRDFVERQENCHIPVAYLSGGMGLSAYWNQEIRRTTGMKVQTWDPFEGLSLSPDAYPDRLQGQQCRFAAAVGAARGALAES